MNVEGRGLREEIDFRGSWHRWRGSRYGWRGLWRGWRGSKLQKLKNIFQTLVIIIHSVSCAIFRAFLFCTLLQSFTVFCTLLQSADMAKINVVTSQRRNQGRPPLTPPLWGGLGLRDVILNRVKDPALGPGQSHCEMLLFAQHDKINTKQLTNH